MSSHVPLTPAQVEAIVVEHRVFSEVRREAGAQDRTEVRLWATLARGTGTFPGSPRCHAVARLLTAIAELVLGPRPAGGAAIEPSLGTLYDSRAFPGSDELYVAITLADPATPAEERERALRGLRARLADLGVCEGGWRKPPERPHPVEPEPWQARPAGEVFARAVPPPAVSSAVRAA